MQIIALCAHAPGVGKSTAARALNAMIPHSVIIPFAGTLKRMIDVLLVDIGLEQSDRNRYSTEAKREPIPELDGLTCRQLTQTLGTEWGRSLRSNLWTTVYDARIETARNLGYTTAITDDCRFWDEAEHIKNRGGTLILLRCAEVEETADASVIAHPSEGGLIDWPFDAIVNNNRRHDDPGASLKDLAASLHAVISRLAVREVEHMMPAAPQERSHG